MMKDSAAGRVETEDLQRISVVLSAAEFERFDAYCRAMGFKKSPLIGRLIREFLDSQQLAATPSSARTWPSSANNKGQQQ